MTSYLRFYTNVTTTINDVGRLILANLVGSMVVRRHGVKDMLEIIRFVDWWLNIWHYIFGSYNVLNGFTHKLPGL
jgi:hypothetical protein